MDATKTSSAALVSVSSGARWALLIAAEHPERVRSLAFIAPAVMLPPWRPLKEAADLVFDEEFDEYDGWMKYNAHYWRRSYAGFLEHFFTSCFPEPHSTKQIEDGVGWGLETTPEVLISTHRAPNLDEARATELASRVRCPVLVIHGEDDEVVLQENGAALAALTGGTFLGMTGSGHLPHTRDPIAVNIALEQFVLPPRPIQSRTRAMRRQRRALFVSSPIGLGHVRRDLAIVRELRQQVPHLEVDWLAQDPVTRVLEASGERVHPASKFLASESEHIERESGSHSLHVFEAWRRMDEIFVSNFMVFLDAARDGDYDLWLGDEAWELDYHLHENPELKRAAYVWLTDIVAWLPMPGKGERDVMLTADYNAEMIEQIERFPRVRDRAIFIGRPEDVVDGAFGRGLPEVRAWTQAHYRFTDGYILGLERPDLADREALRREFGYEPDEVVCIASVGGSGVGVDLLARLMGAFPAARELTPRLRMIAVAGPRLDLAALPKVDGVEVHGFVPDLNRRLAACDVALTQGGLSTTMELTATGRPFVYFPLRDHCEQNIHVRHRLGRYRAGRCMDFDEATPDKIASAIRSLTSERVDYAPVEGGTAARAASLIAELL
jgi:hypothetical protein